MQTWRVDEGRSWAAELRMRAASADYRDRQLAATLLARSAEDPGSDGLPRELVLDAEDTAMTLAASTALMARGDQAGIGVLAAALADADDQQVAWIETGIDDALGTSEESRKVARTQAEAMLADAADRATRKGLRLFLAVLRTAGLA